MSKIIRLHSIRITSLTNPHDDLPVDMQIFAQVIVDGNIFLQTVPVGSEESQNSWKLDFECNIPSYTQNFSMAILRQNTTGVIRLLGSVDIGKGEIINRVELNRRVFHLELNRVNSDGPSLKFSAGFSVSDAPAMELSGITIFGTPDNHSLSLQIPQIAADLQKMDDIMTTGGFVDSLQLWVMHERILLLPYHRQDRPRLHDMLGDISIGCYKTSGTVDNLNQAVSAYTDAVRDDGSAIHLSDLGNALALRFERLGDLADLSRSVSASETAVNLSSDSNMNRSLLLNRLGTVLRLRFDRFGHPTDIQRSVLMNETSVGLTQNGNRNKPTFLNGLGLSLLRSFQCLGDLNDINQAVSTFEAALQLIPYSHPDRSLQLGDLGSSLLYRFERLGELADINQAVSKFEAALQLIPDGHPHRPLLLGNLGISLFNRFNHLGDLSDINQAVANLEAAIKLTPDGHPAMHSRLSSLGNSLLRRFQRLEDITDINQAVFTHEAAVKLTPDGHANMAGYLTNLGNSLLCRFLHLEDLSDINQAVSIYEAAVQLIPERHPLMPACLSNLANSLRHRFRHSEDLIDINQAISKYKVAVQLTPDDHPELPSRLNCLGNSLHRRFEYSGDLDDINQAVSMSETAAKLTPDGHAEMYSRLADLGNCLLGRFERLGDLIDINQAISKLETAIELTPDGHPEMPSCLESLGISLFRRFERLGDLTDINRGISTSEAAVQLMPDGHLNMARYRTTLADSLHCRFKRLRNRTDINRAISHSEAAVQLTPNGHSEMPLRLNSLGVQLLSRSEDSGDLIDINQALSTFEAAIKLTRDDHSDMPYLLMSLGKSYLMRFTRGANVPDINHAISKFGTAMQLMPDGHPDLPQCLINLGISLQQRFMRLHDLHDYQEMLTQYTRAASSPTGAAHLRFEAATLWATAAELVQHPSLFQAYTTAINLLPELAWLGLSISDRHHHILEAGKVVRDAASAAIASNQLSTAVEWLEQGRSVIWSQILSLRTPVDDLRKSHRDLADALVSCSTHLEAAGMKSHVILGSDARPQKPLAAVAQDSHALADKRDKLLKQIRKLAGFERFLLPKQISELSLAALMGPVVLLNITKHRCDALILMADLQDEVLHVPLSNFTLQDARDMGTSLGSLVSGAARSERMKAYREGHIPLNEHFSRMLSVLWMQIVRPVLDGLACPSLPTLEPGRIWWCPTGPLAFLPIHAAGIYGKDKGFGSQLSHFFISSYTPSLTVLIEGVRDRQKSEEQLQILAVAQPSAIGQSHIPGTLTEIDSIQRLATIPVLRLDRDLATADNVQNGMRKSLWAHFACHGVQDSLDPTNSALLLAGSSRLTLSRIIQLSLPDPDLVFLSACQTATGSKSLEDESVHLTAGILLAGYRGVIGTMWSIMDDDAPKIASDIYEHLFKTSPPDSTRAAEALHLAVGKLRDSDGADGTKSFSRWVPFIHAGV